jgi:FkbM family methyltransferase
MAEGWYDHDYLDIPELTLLRRHRLREGARVFDLGAHQCVVALIMSRIVGSTGQVIALEPNSHNVEVARRNRELNDAKNLEVVQAAAASRSGTLVFNLGLDGNVDDGSGEWGRCKVPCISVDDLTARYGIPDVLFIDVEGFEVNVLEGAAQTLGHRPDCFVEVHVGCGLERYGSSARSIVNFFSTHDYRLFVAAQSESSFHSLEPSASVPEERFFMVAVSGRPEDAQSRADQGRSKFCGS